jgi:guanylate kinase
MSKEILILSGPSGSGKSSLINKLSNVMDNYYFSISSTTRKIRDGEIDGKDYYFVSKEQFEQDIKDNLFLEYANVMGNYYGTSIVHINKALEENNLVILDIDVQGQEQILKKISDKCISVFITTPSQSELKKRLIQRNLDSLETINKRVNHALVEMDYLKNYDYVLINNNLNETFKMFISIIKTMKLSKSVDSLIYFTKRWSDL